MKKSKKKKPSFLKAVLSKSKVNKSSKSDATAEQGESSHFQVVKGTRKRNRKKRLICYSIVATLLLALFITHLCLPTGLLEGIQNGYSAMGSGDFPVNYYATNPSEFVKYGDISCVLNSTYFELYNEKGKLVQAVSHGLSNPRLEVSEARFLLFDRDRYALKIYKYSTELYATEFEHTIIAADIARNGTYAVATGADSYLGTVYVYNKNNDLLFTWNSANSYITDVAVAENGKSVAVSLLNAKGGAYISTVNIFDFKSSTPKVKYEFDGLVSALKSVNKNYMLAHGVDSGFVIPWGDDAYTDLKVDGVVRFTEVSSKGRSVLVYGREYNETDNTIIVFNKKGKSVAEFSFNSKINDISLSDDCVHILSNEKVYVVDFDGNVIKDVTCEIKPLFIGSVNDDSCIAVDNSKINLIELSKGE